MGNINETNSTLLDEIAAMDDDDLLTFVTLLMAFENQPETQDYKYIGLVFSVTLTILFSGFGIVTNVINIIVFHRQGILADSSTPSLAALAVSDLCLTCLTFTDGVIHAFYEIGKDAKELHALNKYSILAQIVTQPYPQFTIFTCYITAYIAFERVICVTFPFKVKEFFTSKRTVLTHVIMFCILLILNLPIISRYTYHYTKSGAALLTPTTFLPLSLRQISYDISVIGIRSVCVALVIIFNIVVSVKVNLSKKFRETKSPRMANKCNNKLSAPNSNVNYNSKVTKGGGNKEMKLIRMMSVLCLMMVVSYIPSVIHEAFVRAYNNILIFDMVSDFLEILNSSCNIVIFYTMSSRYRKELDQMCPWCVRVRVSKDKKRRRRCAGALVLLPARRCAGCLSPPTC